MYLNRRKGEQQGKNDAAEQLRHLVMEDVIPRSSLFRSRSYVLQDSDGLIWDSLQEDAAMNFASQLRDLEPEHGAFQKRQAVCRVSGDAQYAASRALTSISPPRLRFARLRLATRIAQGYIVADYKTIPLGIIEIQ